MATIGRHRIDAAESLAHQLATASAAYVYATASAGEMRAHPMGRAGAIYIPK